MAGMGFHDFNRLMFLRGAEELFEDLVFNKDVAIRFLKKLVDWRIEVIKGYMNFSIDGIWFGDDWGTQRSLIISPELWREVFKPGYKRQFNLIHSHKKQVIFHSCGYVWDIMPDLIEIGVEILNPVQPRAKGMKPKELKRDFGDKITLYGTIDEQETLRYGSPEDVKREVLERISYLAPRGGFIISPCHSIQPDTNVKNIISLYDTAVIYGKYPINNSL